MGQTFWESPGGTILPNSQSALCVANVGNSSIRGPPSAKIAYLCRMLQNALVVVAIGAAVVKISLVVQNAAECIGCRRKRRGASFDLQTFKHISKLVKNIIMIQIIHFSWTHPQICF